MTTAKISRGLRGLREIEGILRSPETLFNYGEYSTIINLKELLKSDIPR